MLLFYLAFLVLGYIQDKTQALERIKAIEFTTLMKNREGILILTFICRGPCTNRKLLILGDFVKCA